MVFRSRLSSMIVIDLGALSRNLQDFTSFQVPPCFKNSLSAWCAIEASLVCRNFDIFRNTTLHSYFMLIFNFRL